MTIPIIITVIIIRIVITIIVVIVIILIFKIILFGHQVIMELIEKHPEFKAGKVELPR